MSVAQLSPTSVVANPSYVNPQTRIDHQAAAVQATQAAQKSVHMAKTDTVTISAAALQMSSKANPSADKRQEAGAENAAVKPRGHR